MANNNYAGEILTMESFTAQTTDGSGDIVVTLQNAPIADDAIMVNLQGVAGAFAQFKSRTTTSVTFTVFQKYDKADSVASTTGQLTNLPTDVTEVDVKGSTDSGGGSYNRSHYDTAQSSDDHMPNHSHGLSNIYSHGHGTINETPTTLSTLNSTAGITLVVAYAF